jgi:hypothetical protein
MQTYSKGSNVTTKKPFQFQLGNSKEAWGKCKTLFLVESYKNLLSMNEELTAEALNKIEIDGERLATCAVRERQGSSALTFDKPFIEDDKEEDNEWANHIFDDKQTSTENLATDAQKNLINRLAFQKIKDMKERSSYLEEIDGIGKREASMKIKEMLAL